MKINTKRLWDHIMELGRIGSGADGSVTRFPFTPEDKSAEKLIGTFRPADLQYIDSINHISRRNRSTASSTPRMHCKNTNYILCTHAIE